MTRKWVVTVLIVAACSADHVTQSTTERADADVFTGTWRSITPSLEFIGLTVASKSSEQGAFGSRLTYSGVIWEGTGRIDADSLVIDLAIPGITSSQSRLVLRSPDEGTLTARHYLGESVQSLTMVREH